MESVCGRGVSDGKTMPPPATLRSLLSLARGPEPESLFVCVVVGPGEWTIK